MKIGEVLIENFMAIGRANFGLDDRGLILIKGENKDDSSAESNGSGKSSIGDAISWCLFGETARGESGDAIVNHKVKKDTKVAMRLEADDGTSYVVARHRKHTDEKNRLTVHHTTRTHEEDLTGGTDKITQQIVNQLLGCTIEVFNAAIYAGQERMPNLPAMTDKELKLIIEQAAGIEEMQMCYDKARQHAAKGKVILDGKRSQIESQQRTIRDVEESLDQLEESSGKFETDIKVQQKALTEQLDALDVPRLHMDEGSLKAVLAALIPERDAMRDQFMELSNPSGLAAMRIEESNATSAHARADADVRNFAKQIKAIQSKMENITSLVATNCGECGKTYAEHDLEGALEANRTTLKHLAGEYRSTKVRLGEAERKRDEVREQIRLVTGKAEADALTAKDKLAALEEDIRQVMVRQSVNGAALNQAENIRHKLNDLATKTNPFTGMIEIAKSKLETAKLGLESLERDLVGLETDQALREAAVDVFSPAGVRAHILDHVTPFLNAKTAAYLGTLSDGNISASWSTISRTAKGELREKFSIDVSSKTGGDRFGLLSGGEKRKVRLACALAMQDLVASRATKPLRLFIADEIDDAVDTAGLERLMALLEEKARERGTVLVISHRDLGDWIRESITVKKSGGIATVEGAICL